MENLRKISDSCEVYEDLGLLVLCVRVKSPQGDPLEVTMRFPPTESELLIETLDEDPERFDLLMLFSSLNISQFCSLQMSATILAVVGMPKLGIATHKALKRVRSTFSL